MKSRLFLSMLLSFSGFFLAHSNAHAGTVLAVDNLPTGDPMRQITTFRIPKDTNGIHRAIIRSTTDPSDSLNLAMQAYNSIEGSGLRVTINVDSTFQCTQASLTQIYQDYRAGTLGYGLVICPGSVLSSVFGVPPSVGGATLIPSNTSAGVITNFLSLVNSDYDYLFQTILHELGHGFGLDHTPVPFNESQQPTIMYPIDYPSTQAAFRTDDIATILSLYATNPGVPTTTFGMNGACLHGRVTDAAGTPLNAVLVTAHRGPDPNPFIVTASGMGMNLSGLTNVDGEYTLCGDAAKIQYVQAHLCHFISPLQDPEFSFIDSRFNLPVVCGSAVFPKVRIPYTPNFKRFIYTGDEQSRLFTGVPDFSCGQRFSLNAGDVLQDVNFSIDPTALPADTVPCTTSAKFFVLTPVNRVYVANSNSDYVSVIDMSTQRVVTNLVSEGYPLSVILTKKGAPYVVNSNANTVAIFDPFTRQLTATLPTETGPWGIAANTTGEFLYVANFYSGTISVLDVWSRGLAGTLRGFNGPSAVALSPDNRRLYIANYYGSEISVIEVPGRDRIADISVGYNPSAIAVSRDNRTVYVANAASGSVSVIDAMSLQTVATISVGQWPTALALSPNGARLEVANFGSNNLSVIDTASRSVIQTTLTSLNSPAGVTFSANGRRLYVSNQGGGTVAVFDTVTHALLSQIEVGSGPQGIAVAGNLHDATPPTPMTLRLTNQMRFIRVEWTDGDDPESLLLGEPVIYWIVRAYTNPVTGWTTYKRINPSATVPKRFNDAAASVNKPYIYYVIAQSLGGLTMSSINATLLP